MKRAEGGDARSVGAVCDDGHVAQRSQGQRRLLRCETVRAQQCGCLGSEAAQITSV